ncbi:T-cell surface antigen CD2 [Platysternon megacephalum]|uniref:T-cell surface antigen CD2 n=1 Tax=Platysternon megacephalum TaxID=55544 RepID=A0A4D9ENP2_9SAUR|nr:T-cell surface antigen CD2 [Platysternon megacephalum]
MNFRGIFLAKCLVVLFCCVKGSANEAPKVYGIWNGSVFLNIPAFKVEKRHEISWFKITSLVVKVKNSTVKYYRDMEKYTMFLNGTLKIGRLVEEDSGNYKVNVYDDRGHLQVEKYLHLSVQEMVSKPEIKWTCSQKSITVTCEVKQKNKPDFQLLQNNKTLSVREPTDANGMWKIEYQHKAKSRTAKFQCEVNNDVSKKTTDQEIKCSGPLDIVLIGSIAGGAVVFVIFLALLIYCIRKKRAERYEEEQDEETPMKIRQSSDESKHRELPKPPIHAPQKQQRPQQQRPLPQSQTQYQAGPPRPRPRTQQKSPSHMKERP